MTILTDSEALAKSVCTAIVGRLGVGFIGTGAGASYRTLWATPDVDPTERHDMVLSIPSSTRVPADATTLLSSTRLGSGRFCLSVLHGNDGKTMDRGGRRGVFQGHTLVGLANDIRLLIFSFAKLGDLIEFTENVALSRLGSHPGHERASDASASALPDPARLWHNAHQSLFTALQAPKLEHHSESRNGKDRESVGRFVVVRSQGIPATHALNLQRMHGVLGGHLLAGPMTPFFYPAQLPGSGETGIVLRPAAKRFTTTIHPPRRRME